MTFTAGPPIKTSPPIKANIASGSLAKGFTLNSKMRNMAVKSRYAKSYGEIGIKIQSKFLKIEGKKGVGLTASEEAISKDPSTYVLHKYNKWGLKNPAAKMFPGATKAITSGTKKIADTPVWRGKTEQMKTGKGPGIAQLAGRYVAVTAVTGVVVVVAYGYLFSGKGALQSIADALPEDSILKTFLDLVIKWKWAFVIFIAAVLFYILFRFARGRGWI